MNTTNHTWTTWTIQQADDGWTVTSAAPDGATARIAVHDDDGGEGLAWRIADDLSTEPIQLTADIVALNLSDDGVQHVLVVRRKNPPFKGHMALPGGRLNPGEEAADAAIREGYEEVTIRFRRDQLHPLTARPAVGRDPRGRYVSMPYRVIVEGAEPPAPKAADDAAEAFWCPVEILLDGGMAFYHADILREAIR